MSHTFSTRSAQVFGVLIAVSAVFLSFVLPSEAYLTTAQHAFAVDERVGVYTIEFKFGHENHDVYVPILALRDGSERTDALSYEVMNGDDEAAKGLAAGIVLSNTEVRDGMYRIPKGMSATFTLLTLFTPNASEHGGEFKTQVTHLPFSFDGTDALQLNPSELTYYTTDFVSLRKNP